MKLKVTMNRLLSLTGIVPWLAAFPVHCASTQNDVAVTAGSTKVQAKDLSCAPKDLIAQGIAYLLAHQNSTNGSWNDETAVIEDQAPDAETGMATLALLNAGYAFDDPAVSQALQFLTNGVAADGTSGGGSDTTYKTSMVLLPLCAAYKIAPIGAKPALAEVITRMRNWLISSQWSENGIFGPVYPTNWYYGGFGYGEEERPDLSNTQWALMGISAADQALGLSATDTYNRALLFVDARQNSDGGSGYNPEAPGFMTNSIHTMTAASVWSYALCGVDPSDIRVRRGLQWLDDRYSVTNNDGTAPDAWYYYRVTFAKAMVMSHKTLLGNHDWYADVVAAECAEQHTDGSWDVGSVLDGGVYISTAWAIMALQTRMLPTNANGSMSIVLDSHADLQVYDPVGRHMGILYGPPPLLEQGIPGATFVYKDAGGNVQAFPASGVIPTDWVQVVTLPLQAGAYRIELVGTSDGPFEATILGLQNGVTVASNRYSGTITSGRTLATTATATAMEGAITLLFETLKDLPVMALVPDSVAIPADPNTTQTVNFTISETGGMTNLHSVSIHCTDVVGTQGQIPGSSVTFSTNLFDLPPNGQMVVTAYFPIPANLVGPAVSGSIVVESADGGTKAITVNVLNVLSKPGLVALSPSSTWNLGGLVNLCVTASGTEPLSYEWREDGQPLADSGVISGSQRSCMTIGGVKKSADYTVVVANQYGSVTSGVVHVEVSMPGSVTVPKGSYNGLFYPPDALTTADTGAFTLTAAAKNKFSAKLRFASKTVSFSGSSAKFDDQGHGIVTAKFPGTKKVVTLELQYDTTPGANRVVGTATDGDFVAGVYGYLAGKGPQAPASGQKRYTLALPPATNASDGPGGWSALTGTMDRNGKVALAGTLGDGTKFSESVNTSAAGDYPFCAALYSGKGLIGGWVKFATAEPVGEEIIWLKPATGKQPYANGFSLMTSLSGVMYEKPARGTEALMLNANSQIVLDGGGLSSALTASLTLVKNKAVITDNANKISLTVTTTTGTFKGSFVPPGSRKPVSLSGVVMQSQSRAVGYFPGSSQSGSVRIE